MHAVDCCDRSINFVSDSSNKNAKSSHFLRLNKLRLSFTQMTIRKTQVIHYFFHFSNIMKDTNERNDFSFFIPDYRSTRGVPSPGSIFVTDPILKSTLFFARIPNFFEKVQNSGQVFGVKKLNESFSNYFCNGM